MDKIKLVLDDSIVRLDDIAMRSKTIELEEEIQRVADTLPVGAAKPINMERASYQTLVNRVARLKRTGKIAEQISVLRRNGIVYLGRKEHKKVK